MQQINTHIRASVIGLMKEYHAITHNIANADTVGFKRRINSFSSALEQQQGSTVAGKPGDGLNTKTNIDFTQGNFEHTDNKLDLAIKGEGFFVVETPEGELYTRNGQFTLNRNNQLVDVQGRLISGGQGTIIIPPTVAQSQISIGPDGTITASGKPIGEIRIVEFGDQVDSLLPAGNNCYTAPKGIEAEDAVASSIEQGYLESSNVNTVKETINLISVSRMYEANMKVMTKRSDNTKQILNIAMG